MAWTWTSNFANEQGIWVPDDQGFGAQASYVPSVGFVSTDVQTSPSSFSRGLSIEITGISFEATTISMNYDYTKGSFVSKLNAVGIFTTGGGDSRILSDDVSD